MPRRNCLKLSVAAFDGCPEYVSELIDTPLRLSQWASRLQDLSGYEMSPESVYFSQTKEEL